MAGPQLEDGFTRIANEILEKIGQYSFNGTQRGIIDQIWRYTYGFKRKQTDLALSFLATALDKPKSQIDRELTTLIERNIVIVDGKKGNTRLLRFNKEFDTWVPERRPLKRGRNESVRENADGSSAKTRTEASAKTRTKKESKDNSKERNTSSPRNKKTTYSEDSPYYKMAVYFLNKVNGMAKAEGLTHLVANVNLQSWANSFRLLEEADNHKDRHLLRDVMDWVVTDPFWRKNCLSAATLRKQYPKLILEMRRGPAKSQSRQSRSNELLKRKMKEAMESEQSGGREIIGDLFSGLPDGGSDGGDD